MRERERLEGEYERGRKSDIPSDQISTSGPVYFRPSNISGAAYAGVPQKVLWNRDKEEGEREKGRDKVSREEDTS